MKQENINSNADNADNNIYIFELSENKKSITTKIKTLKENNVDYLTLETKVSKTNLMNELSKDESEIHTEEFNLIKEQREDTKEIAEYKENKEKIVETNDDLIDKIFDDKNEIFIEEIENNEKEKNFQKSMEDFFSFFKNKKNQKSKDQQSLKSEKENNLFDIDSSNNKGSVKYIKNYRKNRIKFEKNEQKLKIKNTVDAKEKQKLKKEFKDKFVLGKEKNTDDNIIELENVNKYYFTSGRYERILKGINLKIPRGKFVLILGHSGSGKTTLLNVISGLDSAEDGNIIVENHNLFYLNDNRRIKFRADYLSFVFQQYNLISTLTIIENIKIGSNLRRKDAEEILIPEILENLGLTEQANKYPYQLSGGQQQRVSIARALAKNPKILFADEPTGALDEERGRETIKLLLDINKKYNTTLIVVTHNPNLAIVADIILKVKDGRIDEYIVNENKVDDVTKIKW